MPGVIPDEGELRALVTMLGAAPAEPLVLRLYVNDHTPGLADTGAAYEELSGHGYAPKVLGAIAWAFTAASPGTNTPALARAAAQLYTFTAPGPVAYVYGYYLEGADTGKLWGAQRFADGPYAVRNEGDEIEITPELRLRTGYP